MSLFTISSCSWLNEDDKFALEKRPYLGTKLRFDGYYYEVLSNGNWYVLFLYRNGIVRVMFSFPPNELEEKEEQFRNKAWLESATGKIDWGVFQIDSNKIVYEIWCPSDGGGLPVYTGYGEIINGSTFHISRSQRVDGSDAKVRDELFHFRQFSPKPDSVTEFIP